MVKPTPQSSPIAPPDPPPSTEQPEVVPAQRPGPALVAAPSFEPPDAEQVARLFERHPVTGPSSNIMRVLLFGLLAMVALAFLVEHPLVHVLPWLLLLLLLGLAVYRVRSLQGLEQRLSQAQELATLRYFPQSLRLVWRLIPRLVRQPELHARAVGVLAFNLDQVQSYEAAAVAYDYLLERMPPEHPATLQLRLQRAMLWLMSDQLADGDDALRRMRSIPEDWPQTPISATYTLATLIQQVRTNHFEDIVNDADRCLVELRPLGMDAAYGHALLALAHDQLAQRREEEQADLRRKAQLWWSRATTLLAPSALIARFPELESLDELTPTEPPLTDPRA